MNGAELFARDFAAKVPTGNQPVLTIRRRNCGCRLGAVHRVGDRLILAGQRRDLVETQTDRVVELVPFLVPDLESATEPVSYGCKHSSGQLLDLPAIISAARSATRRRTTFIV